MNTQETNTETDQDLPKQSHPLITDASTLNDLSAYFSVLPIHKALKEVGAMKYQPKHTTSLISQLNEDLPNIIQIMFLMEKRLRIMTHILESKTQAEKTIEKFMTDNPDFKVEITNG
jgi:hypothetical protein